MSRLRVPASQAPRRNGPQHSLNFNMKPPVLADQSQPVPSSTRPHFVLHWTGAGVKPVAPTEPERIDFFNLSAPSFCRGLRVSRRSSSRRVLLSLFGLAAWALTFTRTEREQKGESWMTTTLRLGAFRSSRLVAVSSLLSWLVFAVQAVDGELKSPSSERGRDGRVRSLLTCLVESDPFFLLGPAARIGGNPLFYSFSISCGLSLHTSEWVGCLLAWD